MPFLPFKKTVLVLALTALASNIAFSQSETSGTVLEPRNSDRPNILYIFTDDQTIRSVSAYAEAHPWVHTPHIDRLAKAGLRFTTAYTGAWCQPSRASALSGRLQHRIESLRVTDYPLASYDPEQLRFFPSVFRKNGYQTACIGKWHLGEDVGHGRDWDYSVIWDRGGGNAWAYYEGMLVRTNGGPREPLGGYSTDRFTELAVDYIQSRKDDEQPWYLWLCYSGVHGPYTPAERHSEIYADAPEAVEPVDIFGPRPTKPDHMKDFSRWEKGPDGKAVGFDKFLKKYHRAVQSLDEGVGAIMEALKTTGQLENTVIVFTSDQGYAIGQHGSREKWLPYDANLCAPLIVVAPGITQPNSVSREPVNGVDIVTTLHSLAGIEPEWSMDGRDLMPILRDPQSSLGAPMLMINSLYEYGDAVREEIKAQRYEESFTRRSRYAWMMLREGPYKYIRYFKDNVIEELYDLSSDPEELNNLSVDPAYRSKLRELRHEAVEAFRTKDDDFVDYLPEPLER